MIITYNFDNDKINIENEKKFFEKYFEESKLNEMVGQFQKKISVIKLTVSGLTLKRILVL